MTEQEPRPPFAPDPLDPGDAEICWAFDSWRSAVEGALWGAACEYRQMYLQLLKRRDIVRERESYPLRTVKPAQDSWADLEGMYVVSRDLLCPQHRKQLEPGTYGLGQPLIHRDGTECGPHDAPRPAG